MIVPSTTTVAMRQTWASIFDWAPAATALLLIEPLPSSLTGTARSLRPKSFGA
jgi:hypothetical protein